MKLITTILTSLISIYVFGQIDESLNIQNKTIIPKKIETKQIKTIDNQHLEIIDTLHDPLGYLMQNIDNKSYSIAIKKNNKFITFKLKDYEKIDSISRIQMNDSKYDELIIFFSQERKWNHADLGFKGKSEYFAIIDLYKIEIMFSEEVSKYENTWGHNRDGEYYDKEKYFKYNVELNKGRIVMRIDEKYTNDNNENQPLIIYEYKQKKLVRKIIPVNNISQIK